MNIAAGEQALKIAVIGGGISGLAAAYTIQEASRAKNLNVTVFLIEAENRLGGKILTEQVDGYTIEGGPDCFLRQKPWAAQLAGKIGLQSDLIGTNDKQRRVYVVNKGRLVPLPDGVMLIVPTRIMPFALSPLISIPGKIRMGLDLLVPPFKGERDESIGDFVRRRLGKEALEKIAEPLLSGIHVSDPEKQSLLATLPRFRALEKNHGSLIQGMLKERKLAAKNKPVSGNGPTSLFLSLHNGLNQMVNKLESSLQDVELLSGHRVNCLERQSQGGFRIFLSGHAPLDVDAVILAIPANDASELVEDIAPHIAAELQKIRYVSTATISLAYRKSDIHQPFSGFGFVIPRKEKRDISACTWTSIKFNHRAPEDTILLRCFVGGPGKEEMVSLSDNEMITVVRRELKALMGLDADPALTRIFRWEKANPQYDVEHLTLVRQIFDQCQEIPGLYLTGSAYEGVGIPDCIRQGQQVAKKVLDFLSEMKPEITVG
ncbi:MAG: oxygen-dependent protoporphyrinogen oxidase [Chloroflexi bacterium]|nr:MAG: oxygen-dependent protoporphyrinogen oxidase [Chloroflexota bacterium]